LISRSFGVYSKDPPTPWVKDILVEVHGMWFDILVLGIFLTILNVVTERRREIRREIGRHEEELRDFSRWTEPEGILRKAGIIRRLQNLQPVVELNRIRLDGVRLQTVKNTRFFDCILDGADFQGMSLCNAHFASCSFNGANFAYAKLSGALFNWAKNENELVLEPPIFLYSDCSGLDLLSSLVQPAENVWTRDGLERDRVYCADFRGVRWLDVYVNSLPLRIELAKRGAIVDTRVFPRTL
jgi:hypothetical protein